MFFNVICAIQNLLRNYLEVLIFWFSFWPRHCIFQTILHQISKFERYFIFCSRDIYFLSFTFWCLPTVPHTSFMRLVTFAWFNLNKIYLARWTLKRLATRASLQGISIQLLKESLNGHKIIWAVMMFLFQKSNVQKTALHLKTDLKKPL